MIIIPIVLVGMSIMTVIVPQEEERKMEKKVIEKEKTEKKMEERRK